MSRSFHTPALLALVASAAIAEPLIIMPDVLNNRLVLFHPFAGALNNPHHLTFTGGAPYHAIEVAPQLWVTEQNGNRIARLFTTGSSAGVIGGPSGGLDDTRGLALSGTTVYVANHGSNSGAPGPNTVVTFDTRGSNLGFFSVAGFINSPSSLLPHNGGLLVAGAAGGDDIHRFTLDGVSLGTFHNSALLDDVQQMHLAANGDLLVAGRASNNIVRLNPVSGALISSFDAPGAIGVYELANGNIMWSNDQGVFIHDIVSGVSSFHYAGGGRYLELFSDIPTPSAASLLALAGLTAARRRRA